jgi:3-hydroxyacyl-CoA dehydrogenase
MSYAEHLENVAVLGAAGKMGSGIVLLTALEMADLSLDPRNGGRTFALQAIDVSPKALAGLMAYLRGQARKAAEKKTVALRQVYAGREDLVENEEIINQYVEDVLAVIRPTTRLEAAFDSVLIFEAVNENPDLKNRLYTLIEANNPHQPWYMTNTSSIPIHELDERAKLGGRIIGFHFYNPPAVQKLVEIIRAKSTRPELAVFAGEYAQKLRKTVVPSRDVAGFIGNGHFMRDALYGLAEIERLQPPYSFVEAVYAVNRITQDYLIRPMGIFQLIDYVGLDVCRSILSVMHERLPKAGLQSPLLDRVVDLGVLGGQFSDGSQKDGFLKYEKGRPSGVFDPASRAYIPLASIAPGADAKLGPLPAALKSWKAVVGAPDKAALLDAYFKQLKGLDTPGAAMARRYGQAAKAIGLGLVKDGVAADENDINTVLLTGFYHAYGPVNVYFD